MKTVKSSVQIQLFLSHLDVVDAMAWFALTGSPGNLVFSLDARDRRFLTDHPELAQEASVRWLGAFADIVDELRGFRHAILEGESIEQDVLRVTLESTDLLLAKFSDQLERLRGSLSPVR